MIFPFILLIADIMLWWLFTQVALLGETLLNIGMFALAFGGFIWVMFEAVELATSFSGSKSDSDE